jgi:hypothetical protein
MLLLELYSATALCLRLVMVTYLRWLNQPRLLPASVDQDNLSRLPAGSGRHLASVYLQRPLVCCVCALVCQRPLVCGIWCSLS